MVQGRVSPTATTRRQRQRRGLAGPGARRGWLDRSRAVPELEEWVVVCLRGITVRRTGVRFGLGLGLGLGLGAIVSWGRDQAITARGPGSSNSFLDDAARLLVGPREQRAHLARCRAERSQSRSRQLTLDELAHAQRLDGQKQRCFAEYYPLVGSKWALLWSPEDRLGSRCCRSEDHNV